MLLTRTYLFPSCKRTKIDLSGPKWTEVVRMDQMKQSGPNAQNRTEQEHVGRNGQNRTKLKHGGPNRTEGD